MMYKDPVKLMLFGAACSPVTDQIAKAAKHWNLVQVNIYISIVLFYNFYYKIGQLLHCLLMRLFLLLILDYLRGYSSNVYGQKLPAFLSSGALR